MLGVIAATRVTLGSGSWVLQAPLLVHVGAGVAGTVTGFVALAAVKGGQLHRRIGTWFVWSMVVLGLVGAAIATYEVKIGSIDGGLLAAYLVTTALTTVRPRTAAVDRLDRVAMVVALGTGITNITLGIQGLLHHERAPDGIPLPAYFVLGGIAVAAGLSDIRMLRLGGLRGSARLVRHLWRMCFAFFVATGSFFFGQAQVFPAPLRIFPLLAVPAFLPLAALLYWLWRIRLRRTLRGLVLADAVSGD